MGSVRRNSNSHNRSSMYLSTVPSLLGRNNNKNAHPAGLNAVDPEKEMRSQLSKTQFIERNGKREYAIVPIEIFEWLVETSNDMADIAYYDAAKAADNGIGIPREVVHAIIAGTSRIKAWRGYRKLTQKELANKIGISTPFLCQIETGKRSGTVKVFSALAKALDVPVDLLTK